MAYGTTLHSPARGLVARFVEQAPREHGFWVMVSAVVLAAVLRNPSFFSVLVGIATVLGAAWTGGFARARIRREGRLQLSSGAALAALGLPIELAGGARFGDATLNALAWTVVFSTFALNVWACAARSSRVRRAAVARLTLLAFLVPLAGAAGFAFAEQRGAAVAALFAAVSSVLFAIWRPGAKQMKAVGLSLAGAATTVALVLVLA